jgi:hypothetical protein
MDILSQILFVGTREFPHLQIYNMKGCFNYYFLPFIFWTSPNLTKYTYGLSPIE